MKDVIMHDPWIDRLSEYIDGELPAEAVQALEHHLEFCPDCQAALAELNQVVEVAGAQHDVMPPADLWPAIAERIAPHSTAQVIALESRRPPRRSFSFTLPQLAAAAAVLMLCSAGGVWFAMQPPPLQQLAQREAVPEQRAQVPSAGPQATSSPNQLASRETHAYDGAIAQLERELRTNGTALDSSTVRVLRQSLATIDAAIADARAAVARDPSNAFLHRHLDGAMKKKVDILRQAVSARRAVS